MACGGCRQRMTKVLRSPRSASPCEQILQEGDALMVEVTVSGALIPKGSYVSTQSIGRALTVMGCHGHAVESLKDFELVVTEILSDQTKAAKFRASLPSQLCSLAQVKKAVRQVQG